MFLSYNEMEYLKEMASFSKKDQTTRQRVTAVAREKFMSIGYEEHSTRMIVEEVGTIQQVLYYHFKNK